MKHTVITLIIAMAIMLPSAKAQHQRHHPHLDGKTLKHQRHWQAALSKTNLAAKTTATDVRLISQGSSYYDGAAFIPSDSSTYAYSPGMGGNFDDMRLLWNWNYDVSISYDYNGSGFDPYWKEILTYTTDNKVKTYIEQEWNSGTMAWDNYYKDTFSYNTSGELVTINIFEWNTTGGIWDTKYRVNFTYNTGGKRISMLQEEWNGSTWDNLVKETNTWDVSNRFVKWQVWFWGSSSWDDAIRETYTYDASNNRINTIAENWWGTDWDTTKYTYSSFVSNHQPQTAISMTKNETTLLFENDTKTTYTYNSYGKPDYELEEKWNATSSSWAVDTYSYATRYHYETYTTVGVDHIANNNATAVVYPVPASASINIDVTWAEAQHFTATIADVTGRPYISWSIPMATKTHHETVPVNDLPPGNYILTLQGEKGRVTKQFTVVR